jgi:hypothetical protein
MEVLKQEDVTVVSPEWQAEVVAAPIALEEYGMTFRCEEGTWVSYPTNADGTCDFADGTAVAVEDWEQSNPKEIRQVIEHLNVTRVERGLRLLDQREKQNKEKVEALRAFRSKVVKDIEALRVLVNLSGYPEKWQEDLDTAEWVKVKLDEKLSELFRF